MSAFRTQPITFGDGWSGMRVHIGEGTRFYRAFDLQVSPKGAKFNIVPVVERWRAISIVTPQNHEIRLNLYAGQWFVAAYGSDGRYLGSIDLPTEEKE